MTGLEFEGFSVLRESFQVGPISLSLNKGDKLLVYGPNGSGKTTFLLGVLGALKTTGSLKLNGREISYLPINRRQIAYQPAQPSVPSLRVKEILKLSNGYDERIIRGLDLERILDKKGNGLSAGQARMVQLASVLSSKAAVILLDEPFAFLSEEARAKVSELIFRDERMIISTSQERDERFNAFIKLNRGIPEEIVSQRAL